MSACDICSRCILLFPFVLCILIVFFPNYYIANIISNNWCLTISSTFSLHQKWSNFFNMIFQCAVDFPEHFSASWTYTRKTKLRFSSHHCERASSTSIPLIILTWTTFTVLTAHDIWTHRSWQSSRARCFINQHPMKPPQIYYAYIIQRNMNANSSSVSSVHIVLNSINFTVVTAHESQTTSMAIS